MNTQKPSRRDRERLQRRSEILATALRLFSEKGFHGTSMQEIADQSEFAVGTLYNFFSHKEEIYQTLVEETADRFHSGLIEALKTRGGEMEKIRACVEAKIRVFLGNLNHVRIYFAETQGASFSVKAGLDVALKSRYEDYIQRLADVFQSGIRKNLFRKQDPYLLALALDAISTSFLVENMDQPGKRVFDAETILEIFLNGASVNKRSRS